VKSDDLRVALQHALDEGLARIDAGQDLAELEDARVSVLGRKGSLARARSGLGSLSEDERRSVGRMANEVQSELEGRLNQKLTSLRRAELETRWQGESVDVTLPGRPVPRGGIHPLTRSVWELVDIFVGLGYRVADGPEVELTTYNFDALNTPLEHPARSHRDTYYVEGSNDEVCLRTETSPVQMRTLEKTEPPVYVVVPGRVYRNETLDATHLNQFAQMEGLAVDEGITMGDLKGTIEAFTRAFFGADLQIRFRPHFFPFTEPSAEVDVQCFKCGGAGCAFCKNEGWIELMGCGMVDPSLLEWAGHDPERYTGFAFGLGIERAATFKASVDDVRRFYENDVRFLGAFRGMA
jgi:phenylalanyl-tRNA synthetase alpha chain